MPPFRPSEIRAAKKQVTTNKHHQHNRNKQWTMGQQKMVHLPAFLAILHIGIRISLANKPPITDCDEVFNYWEPLHFLEYGFGMQTWEYHFHYALRTYAYLLPLSLISRALTTFFSSSFQLFGFGGGISLIDSKLGLFHIMRSILASATAISEVRMINALPSKNLSIITWLILLTSTGMYHAAPALLPSSTVMICFMNCIAEQLTLNMDKAIVWGLLSCLVTGWPFCAVLFVPLGFQAVYYAYNMEKLNDTTTTTSRVINVVYLLTRVTGYAILIQAMVFMVDYKYYGIIISPTWNIFKYNTGLGGGDGINRDNLYGVEDVSYYIKNLFLNWNGIALMGVMALPLLVLKWLLGSFLHHGNGESRIRATTCMMDVQLMTIMLPMYLWMGIVFSRPHKEERFLFPIYPLLAVGASITLEQTLGVIQQQQLSIFKNLKLMRLRLDDSNNSSRLGIAILLIFPCGLVSISRSIALTDGYTAPLELYSHLHEVLAQRSSPTISTTHTEPLLVCTCGEWYRFPSSYHLPNHARFAFLKSSFDGLLPQPFTEYGSKEESVKILGKFNDLNQEEMDRYVNISDCSYVIELMSGGGNDDEQQKGQDGSGSGSEPECLSYMKKDSRQWDKIHDVDFLDIENTKLLHRVLYLPFIRDAKYQKYALFERR